MGKKKHSDVTQETDPETHDMFGKKGEDIESSEIIQFVKQKQSKKKKVKSEPISTNQSDDSLPIESSKVKKLRFNIDGETVEAVKDKEDKEEKKKIKKPRWTRERKAEERKRKSTEPPTGDQGEEQPKAKRKKHRSKKVPINQTSSNDLPTSAIQYLQTWQYDRSSWKFSKIKQIWLLKNIFDLRKVPSSMFPVLVEYISGSQGGARLKTYKAASKIIENLEEKVGGEAKTEEEEIARCLTEDSEEDKEEIHQRARSIMQALSDCT